MHPSCSHRAAELAVVHLLLGYATSGHVSLLLLCSWTASQFEQTAMLTDRAILTGYLDPSLLLGPITSWTTYLHEWQHSELTSISGQPVNKAQAHQFEFSAAEDILEAEHTHTVTAKHFQGV